ncbi:MAG: hypothetical protein ACTSYL_05560 [Candidatus Thorarchaeota archaeon]
MAAATEIDLWTNPDQSGFKVYDYSTKLVSTTFSVGQLHYEWMVKYIDNDGPNYDFYAVYVMETLTPSKANDGTGRILGGTTTFDLLRTNEMVVDVLPGRSSGSYSYGISASGGKDSFSFGASASKSIPDVTIEPYTDANWGGYTKWDYAMHRDLLSYGAQDDQNTLRFTVLIRVQEGASLYLKITMDTNWRYTDGGLIPPFFHDVDRTATITINYDGTPSSGGSGGGGGGPYLLLGTPIKSPLVKIQ